SPPRAGRGFRPCRARVTARWPASDAKGPIAGGLPPGDGACCWCWARFVLGPICAGSDLCWVRGLLERALNGLGHPGLLLGGDLRVQRQRQQLLRGRLGYREVARPVAQITE